MGLQRYTHYRARDPDAVVARDSDTSVYTHSSGNSQIIFLFRAADTPMLAMGSTD